MAHPPQERRSAVTLLGNADSKARHLNAAIDVETAAQVLEEPHKVATVIRGFLIENEQEETANNVVKLVEISKDKDFVGIILGPQIDKGPSEQYYRFDSGARLSFGIMLKASRRESRLVAYRFHYVFKEGHSPEYIRFDLNPDGQRPPLEEARCHIHPGLDKTRLPARVLKPLEVLERVFFVLDKCTCSACKGGKGNVEGG
jgi:hypothetical protein